jgi:hypothetical protein
MFDTLLKAVELLIKTLKKTPDDKRAEIAKELARVQRAVTRVVERGRELLQTRHSAPATVSTRDDAPSTVQRSGRIAPGRISKVARATISRRRNAPVTEGLGRKACGCGR